MTGKFSWQQSKNVTIVDGRVISPIIAAFGIEWCKKIPISTN
jgi:hypothetical protein